MKELIQQIRDQWDIVNQANQRIRELENEIIQKYAGVKPGDVIQDNSYTSYAGTPMIVTQVQVNWLAGPNTLGSFVFRGLLLNKDGNPGKRQGSAWKAIPISQEEP